MLKSILCDALLMMDKQDLRGQLLEIKEKSNLDGEFANFSANDKKELETLCELAVFVVNSITRNYIKNLTVERVTADEEGKIFFDALSRPIIAVKDVVDNLNCPLVMNVFFDHVKVAAKNQEVIISYFFECESLESIFDSFPLPLSLTPHIIALGVVSEYLSMKLLYSEASVFESKFKSELEDAAGKRGSRYFPAWRRQS